MTSVIKEILGAMLMSKSLDDFNEYFVDTFLLGFSSLFYSGHNIRTHGIQIW